MQVQLGMNGTCPCRAFATRPRASPSVSCEWQVPSAGRGKDAAAGAGLVRSRMLGDDRVGAVEAAWGETLGDCLVGM